jgi:hypothetical protein
LNFDAEEYGISNKELPKEFSCRDGKCAVSAALKNNEIRVWKIK